MRRLIIERSAIRNNMAVIKERAQGAALYGVVSGQGGGVGAVRLARLLRDAGVTRFGVNSVEEAQLLRESGFETEEILMLRSTVDRDELERLVDLSVVCTVSSVDTGLALNAVAENRSTVAEAHIQVDTRPGLWGVSHLRAGEDPAGPTALCPTWLCPASTPSSTPSPARARRWTASSSNSSRYWRPSTRQVLRPAPSTPPVPSP